jgi:transposase-like protein
MSQTYNSVQAAAALGISRKVLYNWRWRLRMGTPARHPVRMSAHELAQVAARLAPAHRGVVPNAWTCCGWFALKDTHPHWTCPDCQRVFPRKGASYAAHIGD